jgi:hypothetical protein
MKKKRGRKQVSSNFDETIDRQKIGKVALQVLFGNQLINKYKKDYIDKLKKQYGDLNYLKYLEEDTSISNESKYTQDYIEKSAKRNKAVSKHREKEKKIQSLYLIEYERLLKENFQLLVAADSLEKKFYELVNKLNYVPKELADIIENIQNK